MPSSKNRVAIKGSERAPLPGAHISGTIDPDERIQVTVIVRDRHSSKELTSLAKKIGTQKPNERKHLSREEFAATYGADPADLEKVEDFAHEHDLDVVEVNATQSRVVLEGTVSALSEAFGVYLARYEYPKGTYRGRTGPIYVPEDISPIVEGVFGLDNRPQAHPHFRLFSETSKDEQPQADGISYTPLQIAQLYNFPTDVDGKDQSIAIIELGGGYRTEDLNEYFAMLEIPTPRITSVSVDGGENQPTGDPSGPDGEVLLDIEVAGAIAPGASIVVYFTPDATDRSFIDAVFAAIGDDLHKPLVISISWGHAEKSWSLQAISAINKAFKRAAANDITICCAAGDNGSSGLHLNPNDPAYEHDDNFLHVDFPSSSQYVLCCGGTRLEGQDGIITDEVVWNGGIDGGATGGGVSDICHLPDYQTNANVPPSANPDKHIGRGLPDVAGNADPNTGYQILVDGQLVVSGGTSAVAPLWAGLIALFNQKLGNPVGYLNPVLYSLLSETEAFHGVTVGNNDIKGNNGAYQASTGWNPCTGLGSPDGEKLLSALSEH